jgi:hypothetical protein
MGEKSALSTGATPEYAAAMMKFLGDREPLEVFAKTPEDLRKAVAGLTETRLHTPEKPGKWSVAAVVQHLADVELVLGFRYRKVLGQPGTPVPAIDQDAWAERLDYMTADVPAALEDFEAIRRVNLRLLRGVRPEQMLLFGMHEERGRETLEHVVRLYAAHDCYHLYQIARIKGALSL